MFVGTGKLRKPDEYAAARWLREVEGMPFKQIAERLGVSPGTVHAWARDIELTPEQRRRNLRGQPSEILVDGRRRKARKIRAEAQTEGRRRARSGDPLHYAGCMLYWAEGSKNRNMLGFANSDANMVRHFARFLRQSMEVPVEDFRFRLNVYLNNGLTLPEIEDHWLAVLSAPRSCIRGHSLNHYPTSSSGRKHSLPYGVCSLRVARSTWLVQHIYGAIQEYAGFEEPRWLDGIHNSKRG
jgi:AcrR family transcriptional regulator